MSRIEANRQIICLLSQIVERYPNLRFNQILMNNEFINPGSDLYYEESETTLERVSNYLNEDIKRRGI